MTLVLITMAAGRVDGEETKIRLYWIDRVKTEVIFVAQLLFVVLTTVAAMQIVYGEWKIPGMLIMAGTMTYVCDSVLLADLRDHKDHKKYPPGGTDLCLLCRRKRDIVSVAVSGICASELPCVNLRGGHYVGRFCLSAAQCHPEDAALGRGK